MRSSMWPDVVAALVDSLRAKTGYRTPGDDADPEAVLVLDGPEVGLTGDEAARYVVVGGTFEGDADHGDSGQSIAVLGSYERDEEGMVICQVVARNGGIDVPGTVDTIRTLRAAAFGVLADVELLLRDSPTLGLTAKRMVVQVDRVTPRQFETEDGGAVVAIEFVVQYQARI